MQFKLWIEQETPVFASWNNYGDVIVYINGQKYIYYTKNREVAKKAMEMAKYSPWRALNKLKGYGFDKV